MTLRNPTLLALALGAALAACDSTTKSETPAAPPADQPTATEPGATEVPDGPAVTPPAATNALAKFERGTDADIEKWKDHMGDVPFLIGSERGLVAAKATGRPLLFFYTATW